MFAKSIDLGLAPVHHERDQKAHHLAGSIELTGFGVGGFLRLADKVSNTVGSGSFTIPMMKKLGYKGEFAGAVEAAASTGGQLMPPIMGAAAFLMAESLGLP